MTPAPSVPAYIAALPPDIAERMSAIRDVVLAQAPSATEAIKYGMQVFLVGKAYIFYAGAWKAHVGVYPIKPHFAFEAEIAPYRATRDTLKFPHKAPLPLDLIGRIVAARLDEIAAGT